MNAEPGVGGLGGGYANYMTEVSETDVNITKACAKILMLWLAMLMMITVHV